jgi:hypothetical protein
MTDEHKGNPFNINEAVEILRVHNFSEIVFIKSLLESEGIGYAILDETAMSKTWGGVKARLLVNESDREKAVELLSVAKIL